MYLNLSRCSSAVLSLYIILLLDTRSLSVLFFILLILLTLFLTLSLENPDMESEGSSTALSGGIARSKRLSLAISRNKSPLNTPDLSLPSISWPDLDIRLGDVTNPVPFDRYPVPNELKGLPENENIPPEIVTIVEESLQHLHDEPNSNTDSNQSGVDEARPTPSLEVPTTEPALPTSSRSSILAFKQPPVLPKGRNSSLGSAIISATGLAALSASPLASTSSDRGSDSGSAKGRSISWLTSSFHHAKATIQATREAKKQDREATRWVCKS